MELLDKTSDCEIRDGADRPNVIRVVIADSQSIYRAGISKIIALEDGIRVVAQAESLEQLRAAIECNPVDVVLIEGELLSDVTIATELLRNAPDIKLIAQDVAPDERRTVELFRHGIRGIIARSISPDLLVRCVRCIFAGEAWMDNQAMNWIIAAYRAQETALLNPRNRANLSPREMTVIAGVTRGMRNKEIAFEIGTTEQVIKNYLRKIYDKLGVQDRLELALYCLHNKVINGDLVQRVLAG